MDKLLNLKNFPILRSDKIDISSVIKSIRLLYIFGADGAEVIFVTNKDQVFCYGQNCNGLLGLGHERPYIRYPKINETLSGKKLVDICYGFRHCIGLTADGKCYSWGSNKSGELGIGSTQDQYTPQPIIALSYAKVVQISCGRLHSLALTDKGLIYAWGSNFCCQLGLSTERSQSVPTLVLTLVGKTIVSTSCGRSHSLALTQDGRVYMWGSYQIFEKTYSKRSTTFSKSITFPAPVPGLQNVVIKKVVCGPNHSLLLTTDGFIYCFGDNSYGQIGNGSVNTQNTPIRISEKIRFKEVVANTCVNLSVGVSHDNKYYVWGSVSHRLYWSPMEVNDPSICSVYDIHGMFGILSTYKAVVVEPDLLTGDVVPNGLSQKNGDPRKVTSTQNKISVCFSNHSTVDEKHVIKTEVRNDFQKSMVSEKFVSKSLSSDLFIKFLNKSFNNPEDSDLKLIFNDKFIYCHKTILKIRNKKFLQKIENHFKNGNTNEIRIKAVYYHSFLAFVKHLYGQTPEVDDQNCSDLLKMATIYNEMELQDMCTEYMDQRIDVSNVCSVYEKAINENRIDLEKSCIEFVSKNFKEVFNSKAFLSLEESLSRQLLRSIKF